MSCTLGDAPQRDTEKKNHWAQVHQEKLDGEGSGFLGGIWDFSPRNWSESSSQGQGQGWRQEMRQRAEICPLLESQDSWGIRLKGKKKRKNQTSLLSFGTKTQYWISSAKKFALMKSSNICSPAHINAKKVNKPKPELKCFLS